MILPDVNALLDAHREDAPEHERYATWLRRLAPGAEPFGLSSYTVSGFLRIATHRKIFDPPTPMAVALAFCRQLVAAPTAVFLHPGPKHWSLVADVIERSAIDGALVSDVVLAALALEHGAELATTDADFARSRKFAGAIRWAHEGRIIGLRPQRTGGERDAGARTAEGVN